MNLYTNFGENSRLFTLTKYYCLVICTVLLSLATQALYANESDVLSLQEAETLALDSEPGQAAFLSSSDALQERAIASAQLPDPKLRVGLANYPLESGGFSTEGMTQAQIGVRQAFPAGNTREIKRQQFQYKALEMTDEAEARGRDVLNSVRSAWLETYYWTQAREIVKQTRPLFNDLLTVTLSLYAVGEKSQQDVLRAELELSRLDDRLISFNKQLDTSRAKLSQWIGAEAARPLHATLPNWEQMPELDVLQSQLQNHPRIQAANARISAKTSDIDLANEQYKPGWAVDVGYAYRDGVLPNGQSRSDFISVGVSVDLPVFKKNRQNRVMAAAVSDRRAATNSREVLYRQLKSQLDSEYARWQNLSQRIDLYEQQILVQTERQAEAAMLAYQSEAGDFADVMRGSINVLNVRLDRIRLHIERSQSYAVLANLGGFSQ